MVFVDSFEDLNLHVWNKSITKRKLSKSVDKLLASHQDMVDVISKCIEDVENQINTWEKLQIEDSTKDYKDEIEIFQLIADFYKVNGRLVMIELDVNTAYKHIFLAKSDYEYRFFARRIYTLMYESNKGLIVPIGQIVKRLETKVDDRVIELYKKEHRKLVKFFTENEDEFKDIRNSNEAHKFKDYDVQLKSILNLSVSKSINLIQVFNVYLANMTMVFMTVQGELSKKLNELVKLKV